jgi:hypothetical protein
MLPFYSLDQLKDPEVVKMWDTQYETINTGDNKRSEFPLFHEHHGGGGEAVHWASNSTHECANTLETNG